MNKEWQHQVRLYVDEAALAVLDDPTHDLHAVLRRHDAVLVSQLDAFEAFLADPEQATTPLGRWTAKTLADPEKRAKRRLSIAVRVGGAEVYDLAAADALEAALQRFVDDGTLLRLSRHDTNPADRKVDRSIAHLTTTMRLRTGLTAGEWIAERRMAEVRRLLVATRLDINAIADRTGYSAGDALTRAFRRTHRLTPAAWRQAHQGQPPYT